VADSLGPLAGATVMENTGSDACSAPATMLITMFEYVPTSVAVGLPATWPDQPNEAHCGRFGLRNAEKLDRPQPRAE
jgi:hypothetical protein